LAAKPTALWRGAPGKSATGVHCESEKDHASLIVVLFFNRPPTTYTVSPILNCAAWLLGSPVNTVDFTHSVGPVSVDLSLSSSLFLHALNVKATVQARSMISQFFLFINYLNLVYTMFNFTFGLLSSFAMVA